MYLIICLVVLTLSAATLGNANGDVEPNPSPLPQLLLSTHLPTPTPITSEQIRTAYHTETGKLTFLGVTPNARLSSQFLFASNNSVLEQTNSALVTFGNQFGITDPISELSQTTIIQGDGSLSTVKYQQVFQGVPILAGELIVNIHPTGMLSSISGEISPDLDISTIPSISPEVASEVARSAVAKVYGLDLASLSNTNPELWIFDERLLLPSSRPAELVWRMDVTVQAGLPIRELVLINAQSGGISLHFNQIDTAWTDRWVPSHQGFDVSPFAISAAENHDGKENPAQTAIQSQAHTGAYPQFNFQAVEDDDLTLGAVALILPGTYWYVTPGGHDSNDCLTPLTSCLTINGALGKATFTPGDSILVQEGTYTGSGDQVVFIDKDVTLSGGWDTAFSSQITRSTIDGESARKPIHVEPSVVAFLENFKITNGYALIIGTKADQGAGIKNFGQLTISNLLIESNNGVLGGGGIYNDGELTVISSIIRENLAGAVAYTSNEYGGGIFNSGALTIRDTAIINNIAKGLGGGIYSNYNGSIEIINSTISGNFANGRGGGINADGVSLYNATVVGNSSNVGLGGGIYVFTGDTFTSRNSIIASNSAYEGPDCSGEITSGGYNIVGNGDGCSLVGGVGDQVDLDPMLGPPIRPYGFVPLVPGSPAIDGGNPSGCTDDVGDPIPLDQRGISRDGSCDIGAYEHIDPTTPTEILTISGTPQTAPPLAAFPETLESIVLDSNRTPVPGVSVTYSAPAAGPSAIFAGTGTNSITVLAGADGVANSSSLTAGAESGKYSVTADPGGGITPATFTLSNMIWYVTASGDDSNDCATPATACASINGVFAKPDFISGADVRVGEGVYTGTGDQVALIEKDVTLSGGWDATFLSQIGKSIIDGERSRRGITIEPLLTVVIDGFHIRNGLAPSFSSGGGISACGDLDLRNSTVRGNRAYNGGGLVICSSSNAAISNVEILDNFADGQGGGIFTGGQIQIIDSIIRDNVAAKDGGGILQDSGLIELSSSEIFENKAAMDGGGIYFSFGDLHLSSTSIYDNQSGENGGGIYQRNGLTIAVNSTISDNSTWYEGGGAYIYKGSFELYNSTMVRNFAEDVGGIYTDTGDAYAILSNSILAGNAGMGSPDCNGHQTTSNGYSIIGDSTNCPYTPGAGDLVGIDPDLGEMVNFPGHFSLRPGSPAINAGNPLGCEDNVGATIGTDQRGAPRVGRCDIGAYEYSVPGAPSSVIFMGNKSLKFAPNMANGQSIRAVALDDTNTPVPGVTIQFRAPESGPSGTFQGSGTNEISVPTNQDGIVEATEYIANDQLGQYVIEAIVAGVPTPAEMETTNFAWYVASSGSDLNTCVTPIDACATAGEVLGRLDFEWRDPILLRGEVITGVGSEVILIDQEVSIYGGLNPTFTVQDSMTVIDGEGARRGITIAQFLDVELESFSIENGSATQGGGIYVEGNLSLVNSVVTNNDAVDGGGIYGTTVLSGLDVINSNVSNNTATDEGGGLYNNYRLANIVSSTISSNTADFGGGIFIRGFYEAGIGTYIEESTIRSNSANDNGGGIYTKGTTHIAQSTISENTNGGGIEVADGVLHLVNSTLSGNSSGPAVLLATFFKGSVILNSTIAENYGGADPGGLRYYGSTTRLSIQNSIVAGNTSSGPEPDCEGQPISLGHNMIGSTGDCEGFTLDLADLVGTIDDPIDPMLGALADNGGSTFTHAILSGSPAMDTGDPDGCVDTEGNLLVSDQRGEVRHQGWACDMGSYEASPGDSFFPPVITYTANNYQSLPGDFLCFRNDPACTEGANPHADAAHTHAAQTYTYFLDQHNRDSVDDAGKFLLSSVNYDFNYPNAFWNGSQMVYGDAHGYPLADDVVAHELTHGVTDFSSNLFYYYQSGAINESFSDLWGEFLDLTNGTGDDSPGVKWLIGEDITGLGAIRSMAHPPLYNDPDKMTSTFYYEGSADLGYFGDNGGVHTNSGVNNKAVYLLVDGGDFNGYSILPLGIVKTSEIYYAVQTRLLTSGANYADLYQAIYQACVNLINVKGISEYDCLEVHQALNAVEMNLDPTSNYNPEAEICSPGDSPSYLFLDDFEAGVANWSSHAEISLDRWYYSSGYAMSGTRMLWGDDHVGISDMWVMMDLDVGLPAGQSYLHFNHSFGFQDPDYDGAWLEYSIDGGSAWLDAGIMIDSGLSYNGTINTIIGNGDNPHTGKSAFVGDSHGYVSSRFDLISLAGENVRFRWRMATDGQGTDLGWFFDDVRIYTCEPLIFSDTIYLPLIIDGN